MASPWIVLLGPPASGKGTQGRMLAEQTGLAYFSTGRQLRREVEAGSALGRRAEPFLEAGRYVPDDLALAIAEDWVGRVAGGWIFDGFPRTRPQAESLDRMLAEGAGSLRALLLEVSPEELEGRVAGRRECTACPWTGNRSEAADSGACPRCGGELAPRPDDHVENFRMRLKAFDELTVPVAQYYHASSRLCRVDGSAARDEVFARVLAALHLQ